MIKLSLNRPVTVIVIFFAIVCAGFLFFRQLSLSLFPSIDYPELTVVTEFKGASPYEVEEYVTKKLEQAASGLDGVRDVYSISKQDISVIRVVFNWGENIEYSYLALREKLDAVRMRPDFPSDATRPVILKWNPADAPVMGIFVSSKEPLIELTETLEKAVKQRLEGIENVASVQLKGEREKSVVVEFSKEKIEFYGISVKEIESAIKRFNTEQRGGVISKEGFRYSLRIASPVKSIDDIKSIPLKKAGNRTIFLRDVAKVYYGNPYHSVETFFNGERGVLLLVYKSANSNTLSVIERVKKAIASLNRDFPGIKFQVAFENSRFIKTAISNVIQTIVVGGMLAFLVILFFIGDFKAPLIIAISIPVSILFTFVIMKFFKVNLNIMSLSGLALGVGMLVDNSIVVIESIFQEREKGSENPEYIGTKSVALAVLASTLTTISVFLPLLFVYGISGRIFRDQSLTITASLMASYFVAISLVPVLSRMILGARKNKEKDFPIFPRFPHLPEEKKGFLLFPYRLIVYLIEILHFIVYFVSFLSGRFLRLVFGVVFKALKPLLDVFQKLYNIVFAFYESLLQKGLKNIPLMLLIVFIILVAGIFSGVYLKKEFFPKTEKDFVLFTVELPENSSLDASRGFAEELNSYLKRNPHIFSILTVVGVDKSDLSSLYDLSGENIINYTVRFKGREENVKRYILSFFKGRDSVNLFFKKSSDEFSMIFKGSNVALKFLSEKREDCINFAKKVKGIFEKENVVVSISDNFSDISTKGVNLVFDKEKLASYGISPFDIANMISTFVNGKKVSVLKKTGKSYAIRVILEKKERENLNSILDLPVIKNKQRYKIGFFLKKREINIPQKLERERQMPVAKLVFNLKNKVDKGDFLKKAIEKIDKLNHAGIMILPGEDFVEMRKSLHSLFITLLFSFVLVYLLLCAQFESFKIPFIVIFTFPMGLAGALSMLYITHSSLNVISAIGLIVLSGIVVNDAIVKVDCIHQKVLNGIEVNEAIFQASKERFRPIWMTTITTVIGLLPVFFIRGAGSDLLKPLAVVLTGGMMLATTLTLFVIPALYRVFVKKDD